MKLQQKLFAVALTCGLSATAMTTQAGLFDNVMRAAQTIQSVQKSIPQQQTTAAATPSNTGYAPIPMSQLRDADCPALEVYAAQAQREMQALKGQAETYDNLQQQAAQESTATGQRKMIGGLMSMAGQLMGGTKNAQYAETLNNLGNSIGSTQSEMQLQQMDADSIVKVYKSREADIEAIKIYQRAKKCS